MSGREKEFYFDDRDFNRIRKLVKDNAGINLSDTKKDMVYGRLVRRLRQLRIATFSEYCQYLEQHKDQEFESFINSITTNLTAFFREAHHFEYLAKVLNEFQGRDIRIWSAGCSTGEEPYSLAMTVLDTLGANHRVHITATDLDTAVLTTAASGVYAESRINGISSSRMKKYFMRGKGDRSGFVKVKPELGRMISFHQLNLMEEWPMREHFDIIFCRNVVIYFDKETQAVLFDRYANQLNADAYLFIGHSESLNQVTERFQLIGNTVYRRLK
ncbi:MAG: protein-glutamate O-methyltransferase CheR [Gammaproteobacteria bacterium]|nr:protein-glutamate O-methyltransferase CheR [Gammaproteobacteria bacterium]